ncbi:TonB-dependent receptor domain-containing protein [Ferrimonas senticii]|uniref:TonB-dependent receptor domain-containing protein n=1 Tax=Ferrimonas senticii TaxID=394566 RepID=UPI0004873031|nr:TonB-dependent receptor [Ferrimonas senticii]
MAKLSPVTLLLLSLGGASVATGALADNNTNSSTNNSADKAHASEAHHSQDHSEAEHKAHADKDEHGHDEHQGHKDEHGDDHGHADEHGHDHEIERIVVQSTRLGRVIDDQPMRVEVIAREEIEEKAAMRPGNISMLLAETGGVRVQTTSPALGSANVRLQGLYGRYTQLLADGLPLYGNQASSLGLLQIPPTDLGQVEVIKGSASSLYGGSALGGVINLISRKPGDETAGELLLNATTENGQDITAYGEAPITDSLQGSITAGAHYQSLEDIDGDGWADLPEYERYTLRPRAFYQGDAGDTLYATAGFMTEDRRGGTLHSYTVADGNPFVQKQDTQRFDGGLVYSRPVAETLTFNTRASAMVQDHFHAYGVDQDNDQHSNYQVEASMSGYLDNLDWLVGAAYQLQEYESDNYSVFDYRYEVPGLFAVADFHISDDLIASVSGRFDDHSEYGNQFSPRLSMLYTLDDLTIRGSWGQGYYAPTPFVEEIEAAGLSRLEPLGDLQEETAETASLDFSYRFDDLETSLTLFGSDIHNATELEAFSSTPNGPLDSVRLVNAKGESQIRGSEVLLRYYLGDIKLTASYLYLNATEQEADTGQRQQMALTPEHSAGFVAMWEQHGNFRAGFEAYYTGTQRLNDNPYMDKSEPYWHLGLLGEITTGRFSWFINLENLLDIQQSDSHPLLLPERAPSGQWTTDIWSRNDGFIANAGVRIKFG